MYQWDPIKDLWLKVNRGVCFSDILAALNQGKLLAIRDHENQQRYPSQEVMIVNINNYAYRVPFTTKGGNIFLKTIIPSRKETRFYKLK